MFPTMSYLARQPRSIAVWHPRGALQTEAWRWFLVDREAPQEVKDVLRHYAMRYSGPGGLTEQDDMENWNYASAASKGVIARRYPYNYEMGLGLPYADYGTGVTTERIEQNQRGFYQRWAELMEAPGWDALASKTGGLSAKLLRKIGDGPRRTGQLQDVHAGVGAIDNIDIPAVVHFDVIGLNRHLTGFPTACDRDTALVGLLCNRRDIKGHLLGTVRITDIHGSHASVEVGDEDEASDSR